MSAASVEIIEMDEDVRTALIVTGERSRPVTFKASGTGSVKEVLKHAITETYADVVGDVKLFLQIKDDSWGGGGGGGGGGCLLTHKSKK